MAHGVTPQDYEIYLGYLASKQQNPEGTQGETQGGIPSLQPPQRNFASGGLVDVNTMEEYIRQSAAARGMDPTVAVRVARSEGLAPGVWQSNLSKGGVREPSYGPFQLLVGGEGTNYPSGLGNEFMRKTGIHPSDPSSWRQQIDFALNQAATGGWTPWYGAKHAGIGQWQGIKNATPQPVSAAAMANMTAAPPATQPPNIDASQGIASLAPASAAQSVPPPAESASPLGGLSSLMMMAAMNEPPPPPVPAPAPVQQRAPINPEEETIRTSHTPEAYLRRRRRNYAHI